MARLGINTGTTPNDGTGDTLRAAGAKINDNFSEIYNYFGDGTNLTFTGGTWVTAGAGIHTLSNIGIGTTNPRFALEVGAVGASGTSLLVNGDARVTGIVTIGTSSITLNGSSNRITVGSGVTIDGSSGIISATSIVVNGTSLTGSAVTYITAGSGISVDQSTGNVTITATGGGGGGESYWTSTAAGIHTLSNVGVGTTNPTSALTVQGDVSVSGITTLANLTIESNNILNTTGSIQVSTTEQTGTITLEYNPWMLDPVLYSSMYVNEYGAFIFHNTGEDTKVWIFDRSGTSNLPGALDVTGVSTFRNTSAVLNVSNQAVFTVGHDVDGTGIDHFGIYYNNIGGTPGVDGTATLFTSNGDIRIDVNDQTSNIIFGDGINDFVTINGLTSNVGIGTTNPTAPVTSSNTAVLAAGIVTAYQFYGDGSNLTKPSRTVVTGNTGSINSGSTANIDIDGFKSYSLLKVGISSAAWVVLYTDADSRTADASRSYLTDPTPGSGVIAEVRTTTSGSSTFLMSPGVIGWNNDVSIGSTIYAKVTNNEPATSSGIDVSLTVLRLED